MPLDRFRGLRPRIRAGRPSSAASPGCWAPSCCSTARARARPPGDPAGGARRDGRPPRGLRPRSSRCRATTSCGEACPPAAGQASRQSDLGQCSTCWPATIGSIRVLHVADLPGTGSGSSTRGAAASAASRPNCTCATPRRTLKIAAPIVGGGDGDEKDARSQCATGLQPAALDDHPRCSRLARAARRRRAAPAGATERGRLGLLGGALARRARRRLSPGGAHPGAPEGMTMGDAGAPDGEVNGRRQRARSRVSAMPPWPGWLHVGRNPRC